MAKLTAARECRAKVSGALPVGGGADAKAKVTRLYEAIVNGPTDLDDANLKGRIAELGRIRDAARGTRGRPRSDLLSRFADEARRRIKAQDGSFRQHHVQALAQRVEIRTDEIRIKGSRPISC